jgi:hypothetical protein
MAKPIIAYKHNISEQWLEKKENIQNKSESADKDEDDDEPSKKDFFNHVKKVDFGAGKTCPDVTMHPICTTFRDMRSKHTGPAVEPNLYIRVDVVGDSDAQQATITAQEKRFRSWAFNAAFAPAFLPVLMTDCDKVTELQSEYIKNCSKEGSDSTNPDALIRVNFRGDSDDVCPKKKGPKGPRKLIEPLNANPASGARGWASAAPVAAEFRRYQLLNL